MFGEKTLAHSPCFRYTGRAHPPDRTVHVDYSSRQRYRSHRRSIEARRRRIALAVGGVALAIILTALAVQRPTPPALSPHAPQPTAASQLPPTADTGLGQAAG